MSDRHEPTPGIYNLGSGRATSFNQMLEAVREGLGLKPDALPTDYFEMPESVRLFYQDYTCADLSATDWGLGWLPRRVPLAAIRDYAAYLKAHPEALGAEAGAKPAASQGAVQPISAGASSGSVRPGSGGA
jgi:nucleoside-diphosphate-sugar epimerase